MKSEPHTAATATAAGEAKPSPGPDKPHKLFEKIPQALAAYSGLEMLRDHTDSVKEWTTWLNSIRDAPEEIDSLSAKVQTAEDTIAHIQSTLKSRPDLVDGRSGQRLREQIESSIKNTSAVPYVAGARTWQIEKFNGIFWTPVPTMGSHVIPALLPGASHPIEGTFIGAGNYRIRITGGDGDPADDVKTKVLP